MKYETFIAELKTIGFNVPEVPPKPKRKNYGMSHTISGLPYGGLILYNSMHYSEECDCEPALVLSWHTGGISGGSCWGTENHAYSSGDPEPDWEDLDRILEHFCPNITHLKYKGIMRQSTTDDYEQNEYYGNSTNYAMRVLKLKDLWAHMNEKKLFENDPERDEDEQS